MERRRSSIEERSNNVIDARIINPVQKTSHPAQKCIITGNVLVFQSHGQSGLGRSVSVELYSCTALDPNTGKGMLSKKARLRYGKSNKLNDTKITSYQVKFYVEPDFRIPGALAIKNQHKHEFFLQSVTLQVANINQTIHFDCKSWVYPVNKTKTDRIFFSNKSYLPNQTPKALVDLRNEELISLRGDGRGERKEWERIYDYDYYNDLGNTTKGSEHTRPILGGSVSHPYPRRLKTRSYPNSQDTSIEKRLERINFSVYVPPDERLCSEKLSEIISNSRKAIERVLVLEAKSVYQQNSNSFGSFDEIHDLFSTKRNPVVEEQVTKKLKNIVPDRLLEECVTQKLKNIVTEKQLKKIARECQENPSKFPLPQIIAENVWAWKEDEEFGRQMLAGVNPAAIQCLETFPPRSKNGWKSSIKASHIKHNLDGLTVSQAMSQWRIFMLDHHDYLMPLLDKINAKGVCAYASRTLLFLKDDATLKPLAIELSLPDSTGNREIRRVFLPAVQGTEAALWQLAKAHVQVNDSAYHQLVSHWLKTHAVVEPFIIATRRQLSVMHPIHWLLDPHFKDTMHVNALARNILINSSGILEKTLFTGEISMELSAMLYKDWRFDEQGLPADLVKRRMAFKDPEKPAGVQLLFEDYPYGADGLEIWTAIKIWVTDFCSFFYEDDDSVRSDKEIQAWWSEIRDVGHGDKRNETWWYQMTALSELIEVLTTLIWVASALHASMNFGQYAYAGYPLNRPSLCHKFIPIEGTLEFAEFLRDPDQYYLKMLPEKFEMTLGVALVEVLSQHTSDEVYLGKRQSSEWTDNKEIQKKFEKFGKNLQEVEKKILERNRDPELLNRWGPAKIPYRLLYPDTSNVGTRGGITGKGIPNSISI